MVNTPWEECHAPAPHHLDELADSAPKDDNNAAGGLPNPEMDRKLDALYRNLLAD